MVQQRIELRCRREGQVQPCAGEQRPREGQITLGSLAFKTQELLVAARQGAGYVADCRFASATNDSSFCARASVSSVRFSWISRSMARLFSMSWRVASS